jgi:hypothetical protein
MQVKVYNLTLYYTLYHRHLHKYNPLLKRAVLGQTISMQKILLQRLS